MNEIICAGCFNSLPEQIDNCPECGSKETIDRLNPNCLIYRYEGSDLLEAAAVIKEARSNFKVVTRLNEYLKPINVPKTNVFKFDTKILGTIQSLRNERSAVIHRYDQLIKKHWDKLEQFKN